MEKKAEVFSELIFLVENEELEQQTMMQIMNNCSGETPSISEGEIHDPNALTKITQIE